MATVRERRARVATTLIFLLTGWVYAAWATRIPSVKEQLDLSTGELALAVLGLEFGAVIGLPAGGAIVARMGSPSALQTAAQTSFGETPASSASWAVRRPRSAITNCSAHDR